LKKITHEKTLFISGSPYRFSSCILQQQTKQRPGTAKARFRASPGKDLLSASAN
jgi:hypothetical protein